MPNFNLGRPAEDESGPLFWLLKVDWNDWWEFRCSYKLYYRSNGVDVSIGETKIAERSQTEVHPQVPEVFDELPEAMFSLGQSPGYYEKLTSLGQAERNAVLGALRDIATDLDLFETVRYDRVTGRSILRYVPPELVKGQYHRLANGRAKQTDYAFSYDANGTRDTAGWMTFEVRPDSHPPTNIHAIIGRNGVGKSHLLNGMVEAAVGKRAGPDARLHFNVGEEGAFANVVSVGFSAFDQFRRVRVPQDRSGSITYHYIGLRNNDGRLKEPVHLAADFASSVKSCQSGDRPGLWLDALGYLESDPVFSAMEVRSLGQIDDSDEQIAAAKSLFRRCSSGHKIVLLSITRLVELVHERSLVLIDEPESHLHPPLISAFTRALSALLVHRNGVGVVATHSPVVLQEVTASCAWIMRRCGKEVHVRRPRIQTFGQGVGALTHEVFGLEVTNSGFYSMLRDCVANEDTPEAVIARFGGNVGDEGIALVYSMFAALQARQL